MITLVHIIPDKISALILIQFAISINIINVPNFVKFCFNYRALLNLQIFFTLSLRSLKFFFGSFLFQLFLLVWMHFFVADRTKENTYE